MTLQHCEKFERKKILVRFKYRTPKLQPYTTKLTKAFKYFNYIISLNWCAKALIQLNQKSIVNSQMC